MIDLIAEILPPMLREDLIDAGLHHDCSEIDRIHAYARKQYPEKFRADDDPVDWGRRFDEVKEAHRVK